MVYRIGAGELQVMLELLRAHKASLTADQMARLSHDPDNLVLDLLGKSTGPALVGLQEPVGGPFRR